MRPSPAAIPPSLLPVSQQNAANYPPYCFQECKLLLPNFMKGFFFTVEHHCLKPQLISNVHQLMLLLEVMIELLLLMFNTDFSKRKYHRAVAWQQNGVDLK